MPKTPTPTAEAVAEHGLYTLESLVDAGDFEMAGVMYELTAENVRACCNLHQEARLRSVGDVLGKPEPYSEPPALNR